jgi:hypothetical protein
MPPLAEQVAMPGVFTADFTVVRALLQHGRAYEQAVGRFEPYETVQDPDPETRKALQEIITQALAKKKKAYAYVNNRLEGNAPGTIAAVVLPDET